MYILIFGIDRKMEIREIGPTTSVIFIWLLCNFISFYAQVSFCSFFIPIEILGLRKKEAKCNWFSKPKIIKLVGFSMQLFPNYSMIFLKEMIVSIQRHKIFKIQKKCAKMSMPLMLYCCSTDIYCCLYFCSLVRINFVSSPLDLRMLTVSSQN